MSATKTNIISGLGSNGVIIDCPVGISANNSSEGLVISGKVVVENSGAEVVTVASENFGVKIRGLTGPALILRNINQGYIRNPFESSVFFSSGAGGQTSGRRADITSTIDKDIRFNTSPKNLGLTGPVFTNAGGATGGLYITETNSVFSGNISLNDVIQFGITGSPFNGECRFDANYIPKCPGEATEDDHLINLGLLQQILLGSTTVKTWSVAGGLDNVGWKMGKVRSGNFFLKLFGLNKPKCCCGCQTLPGATNPKSYTEQLQGTWICIGFSFGDRGCSCYDNEEKHIPIDYSAVWKITNNSVKNTLPANLSGTYSLFGILIKPYYDISP
jgi:hypothetical protein